MIIFYIVVAVALIIALVRLSNPAEAEQQNALHSSDYHIGGEGDSDSGGSDAGGFDGGSSYGGGGGSSDF